MRRDKSWAEIIATCSVALVIIILLQLLTGWIISLLWNWIIVALFGLPAIDTWMGTGISILLWIVGGYFRGSGGSSK